MAVVSETEASATHSRTKSNWLFFLTLVAFVSLGLPDGTLGVAWPFIKSTFGLPISRLGVLLFAGSLGYLISSSQSGHVLARWGVGRLLFWSTVLTASCSLGYAVLPIWPLIVLMAVVGGLGAGAIDAGVNAYAAANFSPARINWLHGFYGVGATTGPLLMSSLLERDFAWQTGYAVLAGSLATYAIVFWWVRDHWTNGAAAPGVADDAPSYRIRDALREPAVWVNIAMFFLYAGLESTTGQWAFSLLTIGRNWDTQTAGIATGLFWASLTAGRMFFGFAAHYFSATAIIRGATLASPLGVGLLMVDVGQAPALIGLMVLGFAFAPIFPCLIAETPRRAGSHLADHAIGLQVSSAYLGMAAVPSLVGVLARIQGLEVMNPVLLASIGLLFGLHEGALWIARRQAR